MSTTAESTKAVCTLPPDELRQLHESIGEIMEDQREFTDEFKAEMERGWAAVEAGRVREAPPNA